MCRCRRAGAGAEVMQRRWCRPGAGTGAKVQRYRVAEVVQRCRGPDVLSGCSCPADVVHLCSITEEVPSS